MKGKQLWGFMMNPFVRIAGWEALGIGLVAFVLTGVIGAYSLTAFDGALDVHYVRTLSLRYSFILLGCGLVSLLVVMCVAGLCLSRHTRMLDIIGTMLFARIPYVALALIGFVMSGLSLLGPNRLGGLLLVFLVLGLPFLVWNYVLMYNALKTSTGTTGPKLTVTFIIALLVAEVLSKVIISLVL